MHVQLELYLHVAAWGCRRGLDSPLQADRALLQTAHMAALHHA